MLPKNCDKRINKRSTVCRSATLFPKAFLSLTQSLVSSNIASALASSSLAQPICDQYFLVRKNVFSYPLLGQLVHQVIETMVFFSQKSRFWNSKILKEKLSSVLLKRLFQIAFASTSIKTFSIKGYHLLQWHPHSTCCLFRSLATFNR